MNDAPHQHRFSGYLLNASTFEYQDRCIEPGCSEIRATVTSEMARTLTEGDARALEIMGSHRKAAEVRRIVAGVAAQSASSGGSGDTE